MYPQTVLSVAAFLFGTLASAAPVSGPSPISARSTSAADIIAQIMPTSNTCAGAQFPNECRTAAAAAQPLIDAMQRWNVTDAGQIAGILALIGYESVDMKFKHNVSPGRAGQGTSNMQMANFNREYAAAAGLTALPADDNAMLAQLQDDKYNFGSGPWFLKTKCDASVKGAVAPTTGTDAWFQAYMGCVGVTATADRLAYWTRAKAAFGF